MKLPCLLTLMLCLLLMPVRSEVLRGSVPDAGQGQLCVRGDTVVFHPEAFRMEDGDRLMSLVERLPGVSVRDGKLLWNGTPLRLMMNGLDVLDEDMMLNVVPVHAVDHVLAYGRASGPEDGNGVTGSNSERVLDVRVKPGFMDRFHGEAQARAYAGREYAVSLDVARLSYHNPLTLYVRVADDPEHVDYQSVNGRTIRRSGLPIRQQVGLGLSSSMETAVGSEALQSLGHHGRCQPLGRDPGYMGGADGLPGRRYARPALGHITCLCPQPGGAA